jgi:hypothetical protein
MKTFSENEVRMLNEYFKLGVQIVGFNLTPLAPFLSDKLFLQYIGSILKVSAMIAIMVKKYWAQRVIRKLSVNIERASRRAMEEIVRKLDKYGGKYTVEDDIKALHDIIKSTTAYESLISLTEELYHERVYANTPEVIAFARELQELRKQFVGEIKI